MRTVLCFGDSNTHGQIPGRGPLDRFGRDARWPGGHVPEILVVAPPAMLDDLKEWSGVFEGAPAISRRLALEFEIQADSKEVHFFDAASVCACDPADGFHLSQQAHHDLGLALAAEVAAIGWAE
jgi:lysophospholipase L1-like esterase